MPCSPMTSSSMPRRPSRPPCTCGCRVLTRPSMISGKPVSVETSATGTPAAASRRAVPPVDTSSTPNSCSARANASIPCLSDTLSSARRILPSAATAARRLRRLRDEAVGAKLLAQGAAIDAENPCRPALVSRGLLHHRFEQRTFHLANHQAVQAVAFVSVQPGKQAGDLALDELAQGGLPGIPAAGCRARRTGMAIAPRPSLPTLSRLLPRRANCNPKPG